MCALHASIYNPGGRWRFGTIDATPDTSGGPSPYWVSSFQRYTPCVRFISNIL